MLDLFASSSLRTAFADESFSEHPVDGFYVLAAVVLDPASYEEVRDAMLGLRQRLRGRRADDKLHWNHLARGQREQAVKQVAALACLHVVTIGSPVPQRRQERARAACLTRLVLELHGMGVRQLRMEAREQELNQRDVRTVAGARFLLPKGSSFHVNHDYGTGEPILWVADLVAGAVRAHRSATPLLVTRLTTAFTRSTWSRTADLVSDTRKARLPVCPRPPGLATRLTPAVPCWQSC